MLRTAAGRGPAIRVPSKLPTEPRQQLPAFPVERISDPDVMPILIAWVSSANTSCQTPNSIIGGIHTPASTHFRHGDITDQGGNRSCPVAATARPGPGLADPISLRTLRP